ncbi:phage head spike fiber domain-containing protein [Leisingera sp. ANG-M7]|uniref:phage head spike fiber domain-containing protein n=1 Tax=Leisingera sp. ANG-M7 TaxID=1577902 RepID=UPI00057CA5EB|nr:hypothetical protein [Leisingera sp. ANG-M7]KIC33908.1 hypothetical protein RA26_20780 [Leisingera sp. ANG-M7]
MLGAGLPATGATVQRRPFPPGALIDLDFRRDRYFLAGARRSFGEMLAYGGGLCCFADAAGHLVWNTHNLLLNSEAPASQSVTVTAGAAYTLAMAGTGSVQLSGAGSGTAAEDAPVTLTAAAGSLAVTVSGPVTRFWLYRSDLGGMADNPDNALGAGFGKYVPTGAAPVWLPRRNAYANGRPAGLVIESEARTNRVLHNSDFGNGAWSKLQVSLAPAASGGPRGPATMTRMTASGAGTGDCGLLQTGVGSVGTRMTVSAIVRTDGHRFAGFWGFGNSGVGVGFDLHALTSQINGVWEDCGIDPLGPGLARIWAVVTPLVSDALYAGLFSDISGGKEISAGAFLDIDMIQAEAGATPSSCIPTGGTPVTRSAETLEIRAPVLPAVMPEAVTVAVQGHMSYADQDAGATVVPFAWQADGSNCIRSELSTSGADTGRMAFVQKTGGAQSLARAAAPGRAPGTDVPFSHAGRCSAAEIQGAANREMTAPAAASGLPDLAGQGLALGHTLNGTLEGFRLWELDLGGSGLARLAL